MSQLKVNAIRHTGASSDAVTLATDGTCTAKITNRSNRNLIINGALQCNQYGSSSGSSGYKTVDRWQMNAGGANAALTQSHHALTSSDTGPWEKGFRNSYHILNAGQSGPDAGDYLELYQYIEAQNISQSGWNYASSSSKLTISFWVKSSVAQKFYGFLYTKQGGSIQKMYSFEVSNGGSNLTADTWTKITHTIPGDSSLAFDNDNTLGLGVGIFPFQGTDLTTSGHSLNTWAAFNAANKLPDYTSTWWTTSNATFEFTGVQLEVGDVATDFEHRSYGDELARCKRYYQQFPESPTSDNYTPLVSSCVACHSTQEAYWAVDFRPSLRNPPSFSHTGNFRANGSGVSSVSITSMGIYHNGTSSSFMYARVSSGMVAGVPVILSTHNDATACIKFDSEL